MQCIEHPCDGLALTVSYSGSWLHHWVFGNGSSGDTDQLMLLNVTPSPSNVQHILCASVFSNYWLYEEVSVVYDPLQHGNHPGRELLPRGVDLVSR